MGETIGEGEGIPSPNAREIIEQGGWATCRICEVVFRRKRETARYCGTCNYGYCEGEHGTLQPARWGGRAHCLVCSTGGDVRRLKG